MNSTLTRRILPPVALGVVALLAWELLVNLAKIGRAHV